MLLFCADAATCFRCCRIAHDYGCPTTFRCSRSSLLQRTWCSLCFFDMLTYHGVQLVVSSCTDVPAASVWLSNFYVRVIPWHIVLYCDVALSCRNMLVKYWHQCIVITGKKPLLPTRRFYHVYLRVEKSLHGGSAGDHKTSQKKTNRLRCAKHTRTQPKSDITCRDPEYRSSHSARGWHSSASSVTLSCQTELTYHWLINRYSIA